MAVKHAFRERITMDAHIVNDEVASKLKPIPRHAGERPSSVISLIDISADDVYLPAACAANGDRVSARRMKEHAE